MKTRSQTKTLIECHYIHEPVLPVSKPIYEVNIDFDDAAACWRDNKKKLKNGCYEYICGITMKNGKKCMKSNCRRHPLPKL